ncbi:short-subunit dehydrogenase [Pedobacter sp. UYP30]|uniref:hypothetical protein n=1 Tax=Pedobacter sp. UYP30 TaxID=1756400 RepID=UPI00339917B6
MDQKFEMKEKVKVVLIIGASGGIGEALANKLAERKYNLLLETSLEKKQHQESIVRSFYSFLSFLR